MRDLTADYLAGIPEVLAFFACPHGDIFKSPPVARAWDHDLAEALTAYQEALGGRASFTGNEAVVATGQQPGIFAGPLYTIYKAATAIVLAKEVGERSGIPCTPVFWIAGDDHDFEEARIAHFLTKSNERMALMYAPKHNVEGLPMYRVPLEDSLHALVDEAARRTRGSEFRAEVAVFLHGSLDASVSLADWTARLILRLFRDTPLAVFSPHVPAARRLAAAVLEREVREPLAGTRLINEAGQRLRGLGYPQQVVKAPNECCFFVEMGGRRRKVVFDDNQFHLPEEQMACRVDDMLALLRSAPERFSPNVALRCIVQQHLFPVAAYVAGPGEAAYWAQFKPLFEHFGQAMPIVYPRARCALTSIKLSKLMRGFGFELGDVARETEDELLQRALRASSRAPAHEVLQRHRGKVETALRALTADLEGVDKTAGDASRKLESRAASELGRLERIILGGDDAHTAAVRKQVARLRIALAPGRKPQERVYTVFSFLFEHGWGLAARLVEELDIESFAMKEVEL